MGSQSSALERPEGSDGSRSRAGSHISQVSLPLDLDASDHGAFDDDDGLDFALPVFGSTAPESPRAQFLYASQIQPSQQEPLGRTKKKKKSKRRKSGSDLGSDERDNYREMAPSAEPFREADVETNHLDATPQETSSQKKRKNKKRSKTPRSSQPEGDEDTLPFSDDPFGSAHALSVSSQQAPNSTQLADLDEGLIEMAPLRPSDLGSSRKKKNKKSKRRDLEQVLEPTSELADDPISDIEDSVNIPASVRSFGKRELETTGSANSHKKRRLSPPAEPTEDSETQPFEANGVPLDGIVGDSQTEGNQVSVRHDEHQEHEVQGTPVNHDVKAGREEENDSIVEDESPAVARQQRRGRASKRLAVEIANKALSAAATRRGGAFKPAPEDDDEPTSHQPSGLGSEMDVDNDLGSDENVKQANSTGSDPVAPTPQDSEDQDMPDVTDNVKANREQSPIEELNESDSQPEVPSESVDRPINGNAVVGADGQIPSPPPTEDGPPPATDTARAKPRARRPKKATDVYAEEAQEPQDNSVRQGLLEPLPVVSTPPASSARTPRTQRSAKRKPKTPYFDREEADNAEAFAELSPDEAVTTVRAPKVKPPPSSTSTAAPKPKPKKQVKKQVKKATPASDSDSDEDAKPKSQYRSGALTDAEQTAVCKAVETIRSNAGIAQQDLNRIIHERPPGRKDSNDSIHLQLWRAVQEACPSRPRQKLINWCRQRFHNFVARGTWTAEQDDEVLQMIRIHGTKWSMIGGLINRHQKDVRDRYRNYLVYRGKANADRWSEEEENLFYQAVEKAVEDIRKDLAKDKVDDKAIEDLINWHLISQAMEFKRTRLQCLDKFKRLRMADALPDRISTKLATGTSRRLTKARRDLRRMTGREKYKLACAVRDSDAENDTDIKWEDIVTGVFDGKFQRQALVVLWGRLRETVPDWEEKTSAECAVHITDMYEEDDATLADDRTEASRRSREPTVGAKTPSRRSAKRTRATPASEGSLSRKLSEARIDPKDDSTDDEEEGQLPDMSILQSGRKRDRAASEEVEESVLGDVDEQRVNGDVEMADDDQAQDEEETQSSNEEPPTRERRAESVDLSLEGSSFLAINDDSPKSKNRQGPDSKKSKSGAKNKGERSSNAHEREPSEEREAAIPESPTPTNTPRQPTTSSPKKRRAPHAASGAADEVNTDKTPAAATPHSGESPSKKRRRNLQVYSSVSARERRSRILGTSSSSARRKSNQLDNNEGNEEDEELEVSRVREPSLPRLPLAPASPSSSRKKKQQQKKKVPSLSQSQSLTQTQGQGQSYAGSPSLTQGQSAAALQNYDDLSSDMDDMEDIPAELPMMRTRTH